MRIIMTLMVRDEADIVGAMLQHHRESGIDHVIVTDNASVDGTLDILRSFERDGFITLLHDSEHRKQQSRVVTTMARRAAVDFAADWVVNADADEFLVTTDGRPLRDAFASMSATTDVVHVPVVNLTGAPARSGSGLDRLIYRDHRLDDELTAAGIPAHPTPNAIHRANPEVSISQGNHQATAAGWHDPQASTTLEVLHLPWRSWRQYEYKVRVSGAAYEANPELSPSPRHHGMQDYRRLKQGRLEATYVAKHPTHDEVQSGLARGALDVESRLSALANEPIPGMTTDDTYSPDELTALHDLGRVFREVEQAGEREAQRIQHWHDVAVDQRDAMSAENERLRAELESMQQRRTVRLANALSTLRKKLSGSGAGRNGNAQSDPSS